METSPENARPEVLEAVWDRRKILRLFADLQKAALVRRVQVRTSNIEGQPKDAIVSLDQARDALDDANTRAIQIHYEFDGCAWCDTLMVLPDAIHIIRTTVSDQG